MNQIKGTYYENGLALRGQCNQQQEIETFTFLGELFRGDAGKLIGQYLDSKPSKKFRTWLIDRDLHMEVGSSVFEINTKMLKALKDLIERYPNSPWIIDRLKSLVNEIES